MTISGKKSQRKLKMLFSRMTLTIIDLEELSDECVFQGLEDSSKKLEIEIDRLCAIQTELLEVINKQ